MTGPDRVARLFDGWAARGRAEGMEEGHMRTAAPLLRNMPWRAGQRVLDLGCGNAWASAWAREAGATAVAVDVSPAMLHKARRRGIATLRADMQSLPLADDVFDHVWSMEALYYAPDPDAVLAEARRVLRPGGRLTVLLDHYEENAASHSWPEDTGVPMVLRSEAGWTASLEAAGFGDVSARRSRTAGGDAWRDEQGSLVLAGVA